MTHKRDKYISILNDGYKVNSTTMQCKCNSGKVIKWSANKMEDMINGVKSYNVAYIKWHLKADLLHNNMAT